MYSSLIISLCVKFLAKLKASIYANYVRLHCCTDLSFSILCSKVQVPKICSLLLNFNKCFLYLLPFFPSFTDFCHFCDTIVKFKKP